MGISLPPFTMVQYLNMWLIIFAVVLLIMLLSLVYMINAVNRFGIFNRIENKTAGKLASFLTIFSICLAFSLTMGIMNMIVIFIYLTVSFLIWGLIIRFIKKRRELNEKVYLQGWLAILTTFVYLAFGFYTAHHVCRTEYNLTTRKNTGDLKIAMFADSHLGTTFDGEGFAKHIETIKAENPDIVLIAGDFVDDSAKMADIVTACKALGSIESKYGVWYAFGNHDKGYMEGRDYTVEGLKNEFLKNNVHILEDELEYAGNLCIAGRADKGKKTRKELSKLLEGADTGKYIIVMDHQPADYEKESQTEADLVVSGHTHGGQLFPITYIGEWSGVNDRTYGYERRGSVDFIVTSGISDWALDFKTGTVSEYVIINVKGK